MSDIKTFDFTKDGFSKFLNLENGRNWPVVYLIEDGKELYIGETTNIYNRSRQHFENESRRKLSRVHVVSDNEYNKSAILDTESFLIQYMFADGLFILQNGNTGLSNHNYFDKQKYLAKFENLWDELKKMSLVKKDLVQLKNTDIFKYSPYKSLTEDQLDVVSDLIKQIEDSKEKTFLINGKPGTGKTILAIYLVKALADNEKTKHLKVGLVIPMTSLRQTIKRVFSKIKGLKSDMVISASDVVKKQYDILVVDETHRLKQRRNITNYRSHDDVNKKLELGNEGTELDWILKSSKHQVFLYDANQSVRPSDVDYLAFKNLNATRFDLRTQIRVQGGEEYINFIDSVFDLKNVLAPNFKDYDFKVYDSALKMVNDIKQKNKELELCRVVAGYAWPWVSRDDGGVYDIEIDDLKIKWNSTTQDWVNSPNAINEAGCIHTVQGYDLNYVGVIIGPELSYDKNKKQLVIKNENYHDANGWRGIEDPKELERYIINIYRTLLTRGIKGAYVYAVDKNLNEYLKGLSNKDSLTSQGISLKNVSSPYMKQMVRIPLVGSVPCGTPLCAEENIEEFILVPGEKIRNGSNYFILRASGDSMNKAGINDGDLILCLQKFTAHENDKVVALIGDEVTVKEFHREGDRIVLQPCSTNKVHKPIYVDEDIQVQGVVQGVLENLS